MKIDKGRFLQASYNEQAVLLLEQYQFLLEQQQQIEEEKKRLYAYQQELAKRIHHTVSNYASIPDNESP